MSVELNSSNFEEVVLKSDKPVIVDFWAVWCMPCQMLHPVLSAVEDEIGDKIVLGKVNVDEERELAAKYNIMSIPTVIIFKDGKIVKQFVGVQPKDTYINAVKEILVDAADKAEEDKE